MDDVQRTTVSVAIYIVVVSLVGCGGVVDAAAPSDSTGDSCEAPPCAVWDASVEVDSGSDGAVPDAPLSDASDVSSGDGSDVSNASDAPSADDARDAPEEPQAMDSSNDEGSTGCPSLPPGVCDPVRGCGCPVGYSCTGTGCRLYGNIGPYEHCADPKDCGFGLVCSSSDVCVPYCRSSADCEGADPFRACNASIFSGGYGTCARQCDPVDPTGSGPTFWPCGEGLHCAAYLDGSTICGDFITGTPQPLGTVCAVTRQCEMNAACDVPPTADTESDAGTTKVCLRWCHTDGTGSPCDPPTICVPNGLSAGATALGYCVAP